MEEILINVGSDSDNESSDEELEPDNDDLQSESVLSPSTPAGEKPCCSRQLQLEHIGSLSPTALKSVLPLNL